MSNQDHMIGIVQNGHFQVLSPTGLAGHSLRLTRISMQTAMTPEFEEVDLHAYERKALMVTGHESGGWLYSAEVVDEAGPILTAMVRRVFSTES